VGQQFYCFIRLNGRESFFVVGVWSSGQGSCGSMGYWVKWSYMNNSLFGGVMGHGSRILWTVCTSYGSPIHQVMNHGSCGLCGQVMHHGSAKLWITYSSHGSRSHQVLDHGSQSLGSRIWWTVCTRCLIKVTTMRKTHRGRVVTRKVKDTARRVTTRRVFAAPGTPSLSPYVPLLDLLVLG